MLLHFGFEFGWNLKFDILSDQHLLLVMSCQTFIMLKKMQMSSKMGKNKVL